MALVTLAQAKRHLNIATTDRDADVLQKVDAASAAILKYLKGRRISVSELTSSGGVATVETPVPHLLTSNDTVTVWGTEQPEYNGTFTVTVTDANNFTFSIYSDPETPATGYIGIITSFGWTDVTVPEDVRHAVLLLVTHLYENRGDDLSMGEAVWAGIERLLSSYRTPTLA